jgi:hypothetical protein
MATLQEKLARLDAAKAEVESLVAAGVDLESKAAAPAGLELVYAFDEVAQELGYKILKPL